MLKVERESESMGGPPYESCCKCSQPTPFWYTPKDVPLCLKCAEVNQVEDIPDKEKWFKSTM